VGGGGDSKEAQHERARTSGQSMPLSVEIPRGRLACPVSQRAVREVPAAWECCRQLSEMCDSPIVADGVFSGLDDLMKLFCVCCVVITANISPV
jgi:hypothetical protein